ncbi:sensor histidine kinase [Kamptonema formosum]|uniref:sensor histidine kinase n=1 Tax=Kamptonema formosum TaxID=331992 RepID=UPI00034846B2|nr:ATP-binding protein [Oscillatoria sp. PCC 10802]
MVNACFFALAHFWAHPPLGTVDGAANLFIASCYFTISTLLAIGLWRNRHEGVDVLVGFTAGIFLSCALGHTAHGIGMLGLADTMFWQTSFDLLTAIPAVGCLSNHGSYSVLVQFGQIIRAKAELEEQNARLEQIVDQRTQELKEQNQRLQEALTEQQRMQGQLVQMEKMSLLGQMVSGISHEINNPINFIYGNLPYVEEHVRELLKVLEVCQSTAAKESERVQEVLEEIDLDFILEDLPRLVDSMKLGAVRIRELVLNLRSFYRLDEAQMKPADLHEGIESTLVLLHNRYKKKIEVVRRFGNIPRVECYINQINQVFMNLLSNAIDALLAGAPSAERTEKRIEIATEQISPEWVAVRIADSGAGISPEIQARIFEPLFTTKPRDVGTGLGLAISHQIVTETHRGRIYCNSELGKGTTFTVELPVFQPKECEGVRCG